ncbi:hypothetical protein GE061_003716 [Apolygus lucorum]|uniref:Sepiapterin reductase n=1 Tax=Apolygus lucorum TaxID=248454 RepID=A0A8S9X4K2_APOLU|nr:hypothetical protein GE061_003716 [Apolygus lucorum]
MVMGPDPWLPANTSGVSPTSSNQSFEDDFVTPGRLPDSDDYIACLERKLKRIQKGRGQSSKNLLKSLEERRQDCIARLLAEDLTLTPQRDEFSDQDVPTKWLKSYLNPEQALTVSELVELVKADYLAKEVEKDEGSEKTVESSVEDNEADSSSGVQEGVKGDEKDDQGIGQGVAFEFAKVLAPDSKLCLTARSVSGLNATARKIKEINPDIITEYVGCDLSKDFDILLKRLESFKSELYDSFFLVHNAGTEGKGSLAKDMDSVQYWQEYMSLNLYSMTVVTSAFLRIFNSGAPRTIINITSLAAVVPFKGMGFYCVSKSSREMYLKVLGEENPDLHILNYSPGVVRTDMISRVINTVDDQSTKQSFESLVNDNKLVEPSETIGYLIKVLDEGSYKNGGRVDFFDRDVTNGVDEHK